MAKATALTKFIAISALLCSSFGEVKASVFESAKIQRIVDGNEVYIDKKQAKTNELATKGQQAVSYTHLRAHET